MNFPDLEIQCEETTPKPCKKQATHMIVMHHADTDCHSKTFALCDPHALAAAGELTAALITHAFMKATGEDLTCPDCNQQVTEPEHVGSIEKI